jgi:hypothetical protein
MPHRRHSGCGASGSDCRGCPSPGGTDRTPPEAAVPPPLPASMQQGCWFDGEFHAAADC